MEFDRLTSRFITALRERGYPENIEADNLNIITERSLLKQVEQLLTTLERESLTLKEAERFSSLEAAGVTTEESFEVERLLITGLESSIENINLEIRKLENEENPQLPLKTMPDTVMPFTCPLPIADANLFLLERFYSLIESIKQECLMTMDVLENKKLSNLPGYEFETIDDWQAFTLATIDDVEDVWKQISGNMVILSDSEYISQRRNEFLRSLYSRIIERLDKISSIQAFLIFSISKFEEAIGHSTNVVLSLSKAPQSILQRSEKILLKDSLPTYNFDFDYGSTETLGPNHHHKINGVQDLPLFELKHLLKKAHDYSLSIANLIRELQNFNKG